MGTRGRDAHPLRQTTGEYCATPGSAGRGGDVWMFFHEGVAVFDGELVPPLRGTWFVWVRGRAGSVDGGMGMGPSEIQGVFTPVGEDQGMNDLLKGTIAGFAAWKLGGGCFGTIIVFVLIYWLLGHH